MSPATIIIAGSKTSSWSRAAALAPIGSRSAWPRILPAGRRRRRAARPRFYDRLVDGLMARSITPWLCLYHWDLPQALQDKDGWLNRDTAAKFADYARVVAKRLGDRVKHWATFNEPNIHAMFGHGVGEHAPGLKGLPNMLAAMHHQNLAQGMARLRRCGRNMTICAWHDPVAATGAAVLRSRGRSPRRRTFRRHVERRGARSALARHLSGRGRGRIRAAGRRKRPRGHSSAARFSRRELLFADVCRRCAGQPVRRLVRRSAGRHPFYRDGLADRRRRTHRRNDPAQPAIRRPRSLRDRKWRLFRRSVGADGVVHDDQRIGYLREHLAAAQRAVAAGVKLRGYFVWSLLDNFEWAEGYRRRFGVVRVDFATLRRTPKASFASSPASCGGHSRTRRQGGGSRQVAASKSSMPIAGGGADGVEHFGAILCQRAAHRLLLADLAHFALAFDGG